MANAAMSSVLCRISLGKEVLVDTGFANVRVRVLTDTALGRALFADPRLLRIIFDFEVVIGYASRTIIISYSKAVRTRLLAGFA